MTTVLVLAPYRWGRGKTIEEARNAGSIGPKDPQEIFVGDAEKPFVDMMGNVRWEGPGAMVSIGILNAPKKKKKGAAQNGRRRRR